MWDPSHIPFRTRWLWNNPHIQTLGCWLLRGEEGITIPRRYAIRMADGDQIVIHDNCPQKWITGDRVAVLVHGLCGSHCSPQVRRTGVKLRRRGIRTIRVDMRGWGDSTLVSRGHTFAGASQDLSSVVAAVHQLFPISQISLIGFSLGGNVVLKLLGEWASEAPKFVDSAIAVSPPVDLIHASSHLRHWGNRIYDYYFTRLLTSRLRFRRKNVPNLVDNGLVRLPDRLVHFDDQFTAPIFGFSGAREYYRRCGAGPLLRDIAVPTLIVAAEDDPIVPHEMFQAWPLSSKIEMIKTRRGGHLGFVSNLRLDPDPFWLEWRIAGWIASLDS